MTDSDAPARTRNVAQVFSGLSADEQEILDQAGRFARRDLYPLAQRMDDEEWLRNPTKANARSDDGEHRRSEATSLVTCLLRSPSSSSFVSCSSVLRLCISVYACSTQRERLSAQLADDHLR